MSDLTKQDYTIANTKLANQRTYLAYVRTGFVISGWQEYSRNIGLLFLVC